MKNIYMAQPNSQYGNSIYFPYAAGSLIAYSFKNETIKNEYSLKEFIYKKEKISDIISKLDAPFVFGFSCYIWNFEFNKQLASAVKEAFPDCKIIFGGHQVSPSSEIMTADYVDYVLLGEGEESFKQLLLSFIGEEDIENIPNIAYKKDGEMKFTQSADVSIPERVSPYAEGYFDEMVKAEELEFSAILETNRGCPNKCTFCDWGNIKAKIKLYDIETVKKEIDWMSENKIEYCYCADSNFGMFPRDMEIMAYVIEKFKENGYPQKFQATYSKNNPETVFEITRMLNSAGMSKGATVSFQSMHQNVLDNIYRKNMPIESFKKLMSLYNENGISAYSEIIICLPGETYESFRDGIEQLLEAGQHMSINFFNCELLANSTMNEPEYVKHHKIEYATTELQQYHVVPDEDMTPEKSRIVVSTAAMPREMWLRSNILSVFIRAFHNLGLLQSVAIYLFYEKQVKYTDFYCSLIEWSKNNPDSVCGKIYYWLVDKYSEVLQNKGSLTCVLPDFGEITWPLDEGAFLRAVKDYDKFLAETEEFIKKYFDDEKVFDDLMKYQTSIVKTPYSKKKSLKLSFDWYDYFKSVYSNSYEPLKEKEHTLEINAVNIPSGFEEYAKQVVWFGRKGGQNIITDIKYTK